MVSIKTADPQDARSIMSFLRLLSREAKMVIVDPQLFSLTIRQESQQIRIINHTRENVIIIAKLSDCCIGIVTVSRINSVDGELGIAVAKQFRDHGLGKVLMSEAIRWLHSFSDLRHLILTVDERNRVALHLYLASGFTIVSKQLINNSRQSSIIVIKMKIS